MVCQLRAYVLFYFILYFILKRNTLLSYANSVDTDQMPHFSASDLGLHSLPMSIYRMLSTRLSLGF